MVREPNPMSRLMKLAAPYRGKFMLSVILAVFGVAAGLLPFFAVSRIVVLLMEKETSVSVYMDGVWPQDWDFWQRCVYQTKGFFDHIDHEWAVRFIESRINVDYHES